jgi:polyhydroxyalkanoate synthesis repressor PhaR
MIQIKRYANRKYYDSHSGHYITLEEIAAYIRNGEAIQVTDHATSQDITSFVMTQIILSDGKRHGELLPNTFLINLIQKSKNVLTKWESDLLQSDWSQAINSIIQARVEDLVSRQEITPVEGSRILTLLQVNPAEELPQVNLLKEFSRTLVASLQLPTNQDIQELSEQIQILKQKIEETKKTD